MTRDIVVTPTQGVKKRRRPPSLGLRTLILSLFMILFVGSWAAVSFYVFHKNKVYLTENGQNLLDKHGRSVHEQMLLHFESAEKTLKKLRYQFTSRTPMLSNVAAIQSMLASLSEEPLHSAYFIADSQGQLLFGNRVEPHQPLNISTPTAVPTEAHYHLWSIVHHGEHIYDYHKFADLRGHVLGHTVTPPSGFDARTRPWFRFDQAHKDDVLWTDMYAFITGHQGVTGSIALYDEEASPSAQSPTAVLGLNLNREGIASILQRAAFSEGSLALIVDKNGGMLAAQGLERYTPRDTPHTAVPLRLEDVSSELVQRVAARGREGGDRITTFPWDNEKFYVFTANFPSTYGSGWSLLIAVPEHDFVQDFRSSMYERFAIAGSIVAFSVFLLFIFAGRLTHPIRNIAKDMLKIQNFDIDHTFSIRSYCREIQQMFEALKAMKQGLDSFSHFVPRILVRQLIQSGQGARLGGEKRKVTVFFSDIQNFTTISESMEATALASHLSEYLTEVTDIIQRYNGTIDKYIGDSVMAFWGAPIENPRQAFDACDAALAIQVRLRELNQVWKAQGRPQFLTRIGIHSGEVLVGNLGSEERMNYTLVGDAVNLASRLEGLNKDYHTYAMVSERIVEEAATAFVFRPMDRVAVKGKAQGLEVFELRPHPTEASQKSREGRLLQGMRQALDFYYAQRWDDALAILGMLAEEFPGDGPISLLKERCLAFQINPPPQDWDGIRRMDHK